MPLLGLYKALVRQRYETGTRADEIHRVPCADGVRIAIKRFLPHRDSEPRRLPVLCVPGLGADSTNFDAPEPYGLAPWLAGRGFDTWVIDLRGTGMSKLPYRKWVGVTFDDFVGLDLVAAVDHLCAKSGAPGVMVVGHSMGGLALYAMLARQQATRVRAGVTLGSPLGFPQGWEAMPLLRPLKRLGDIAPGLHLEPLSQLVAPLALRFNSAALKRFLVLDNVDTRMARRLMYRAVQSIPRGLMLQFREWIDRDVFRSADGELDYRARLAGCALPVLVVGAPHDGLARLDAVRRALPLLPHARFLLAGRDEGMSTDYGHIDLLFGRRAHQEVFPRIADWLGEHDAVATSTRRLRVVAL
ncbi:MAG: alpha/beta fold hydrolase [Deltaproteobacteria bacterium]|nr:alpha/beta fold hydrolase [Deltaproteobacteria bacterium]